MSELLPAAYTHGKVVGRFIKAVGDSEDVGVLPEAVPASGSVTFIPDQLERIVTDATVAPSATPRQSPREPPASSGAVSD